MVNYANAKIYKLVSFQTDKIYIGSTCEALSLRKAKHKANYKMFVKSQKKYTTSFEILKLGDTDIILLENCPCNSKEELHKRERYFIENTPNCVNKNIPTRKQKEYYETNLGKVVECEICKRTVRENNLQKHLEGAFCKNSVSKSLLIAKLKDDINKAFIEKI
jgi:hypothetical protein